MAAIVIKTVNRSVIALLFPHGPSSPGAFLQTLTETREVIRDIQRTFCSIGFNDLIKRRLTLNSPEVIPQFDCYDTPEGPR